MLSFIEHKCREYDVVSPERGEYMGTAMLKITELIKKIEQFNIIDLIGKKMNE